MTRSAQCQRLWSEKKDKDISDSVVLVWLCTSMLLGGAHQCFSMIHPYSYEGSKCRMHKAKVILDNSNIFTGVFYPWIPLEEKKKKAFQEQDFSARLLLLHLSSGQSNNPDFWLYWLYFTDYKGGDHCIADLHFNEKTHSWKIQTFSKTLHLSCETRERCSGKKPHVGDPPRWEEYIHSY